jgi:hypothetical protein
MNMNSELQIETIVLSKVLDRSITMMHIKHYNRCSRIIPMQITKFSM